MKKLSISDKDVMQIAIQQEIGRSEESRYDHRLHGVLLVSKGLSCYKAAGLLGQNATTVQRWVNTFERDGFSGLQDKERTGRPKKLSERELEEINQVLREEPYHLGYSQNIWDGKLLSYHIKERHGKALGVRQCQRIFRQLGFRFRKPRPVIAHADPAEQAAFKKTAGTKQRKKE
jgi:transposase